MELVFDVKRSGFVDHPKLLNLEFLCPSVFLPSFDSGN